MARDFGYLDGPGGPLDPVPDCWVRCKACGWAGSDHDLASDPDGELHCPKCLKGEADGALEELTAPPDTH